MANEAIQIDILVADHFHVVAEEELTTKNVSIQNNVFRNVFRGVGSHTAWIGTTVDQVVISNNTFENIPSVAIECMQYTNCTIENNKMTKCGRGITVFALKENGNGMYNGSNASSSKVLNAKTVIRNNTISVENTDESVSSGIAIQGARLKKATKGDGDQLASGNYIVQNVKIENNTIQTKNHGIMVKDGTQIAIKNNTIKGNKKALSYGVMVANESKNVSVTGNTISGSGKAGVAVIYNSHASVVTKNTIQNAKENGIWVNDSKVNSILSNRISKCGINGIKVGEKANAGKVQNNTIKSAKKNGIFIFGKSKVGSVSKNKISGSSRKITRAK